MTRRLRAIPRGCAGHRASRTPVRRRVARSVPVGAGPAPRSPGSRPARRATTLVLAANALAAVGSEIGPRAVVAAEHLAGLADRGGVGDGGVFVQTGARGTAADGLRAPARDCEVAPRAVFTTAILRAALAGHRADPVPDAVELAPARRDGG